MNKNTALFFCIGLLFENLFSARLHDLVQEGCCEQLQHYLELESRCNLNEIDETGKTALYYACKKGSLDMVKYLYARGASLDPVTLNYKQSLLHCACMFNHKDLIMFLLQKGVNPSPLNIWDNYPYDILPSNEKKEYTKIFDDALYWKNEFKQKITYNTFLLHLDHYETSRNHAQLLRLGFLVAYNQGMVRFFETIYQELYAFNDTLNYVVHEAKIDRQDNFEIMVGSEKSLASRQEYQMFFVNKALKEKNHEFLAAALSADWVYDEKNVKKYVPYFSTYQKDMIKKIIIGKRMNNFKSDIYFVYKNDE